MHYFFVLETPAYFYLKANPDVALTFALVGRFSKLSLLFASRSFALKSAKK
jgi:hypothetical protein